MQRTSADGVTVLWTDAPGPLTAQLSFGCGVRDETAPTMGVTRVIEALVMAEVGPRLHQFASIVDAEETHFHAAGTPEAVTDFLHTVCRTLSDLPLHRTEHTARLLSIDGAPIPEHGAVAPLGARFGPHAFGLVLHHDTDMYAAITPDTVRAHAATYFTRGNAVLALDGPVPEGLTLPLPAGPGPERTTPRTRAGRSWQHRPVDTVSLLLTSGTSSAPAMAAHMTLRRRVERAVRDLYGVSNQVSAHFFIRDRLTQDRVLLLDILDGHAEQAAETLWHETLRLTREGPAQTELDEYTAYVHAELDFIGAHWRALERAVTAELFGTPFLDDRTLLEGLEAVTPQDVRHYLEQALTDAVLVVPHQVFPRLTGPRGTGLRNSDCWRTEGPPTTGTLFPMPRLRRAISPRDERGEWVLTPWGLVCRDGTADEHDIRFDEIALMIRDGDNRAVLTGCGCDMTIYPQYFKRGEQLIAALDAAVPTELVRDAP
ncbi:hypothetical protein OG625_29020 [Streptomyces sp. NBC_01351]|uniref:hypothetical protein n=1 Tax=Streptomyces sp. NBC_01351 TaxID=2903833 RepID=UPI002E3277BC|nr:hypothetical protein [Streptomyces sp. NBC_01351]